MFKQFPKVRPKLPAKLEKIYTAHIQENRAGASRASALSKKMEAWMHDQVAADIARANGVFTTLEVGAGTLNHLPYEPEAQPYDIVEPFRELYLGSALIDRIRSIYEDINQVTRLNEYDRIISIATFEHICNLPEVVARCGLLLKPGGVLRVAIPNEGTLLWSLGWRLTTGIEFWIRYHIDYAILMSYEHVNNANEIEEILTCFFISIQSQCLGVGKKLAFYRFFECREPNKSLCKDYLAHHEG